MRILLTGGGGLIGHTVRAELAREHDIVQLGRGEDADVRIDLADATSFNDLKLPATDALVHCAGIVDEDFRQDPARAMRMAIAGTEALVHAATAAGARRLVYVSSAHVYGPMVGTIDERCTPNPLSDYAIAHFAAEQVFRRRVSAGSQVLALRPCAVFGDVRDVNTFRRWSLIPYSFPWEAIRNGRIVIRSTGEQRRNFVGTADIAALIRTWLVSADDRSWQVLNPLGRLSCTVHEFGLLCAKLSEEFTGKRCEVERVTPVDRMPGEDFDYQSISGLGRGDQSPEAFLLKLMRELQEAEVK